MSNTYSFLHTVATQTPAIRSLHDLSVYHHQLWEIVLIGFFTLMATLAWYIFVKRSANKELGDAVRSGGRSGRRRPRPSSPSSASSAPLCCCA